MASPEIFDPVQWSVWDLFNHNKRKWLKQESELFNKKWFDYRFLTPSQATIVFAKKYAKIVRHTQRTIFNPLELRVYFTDRFQGLISTGTIFEEASTDREFKLLRHLWRGRQIADTLGMPYEVFLNEAMRTRLSYWNKRYAPAIQTLCHAWIAMKVASAWDEYHAARLFYSKLPAYSVEHFKDLPHQNDHRTWLLDQIKLRPGSEARLFAQFIHEKLLPIELADTSLSADDFDLMNQYINDLS